jgi:hypothetical protein
MAFPHLLLTIFRFTTNALQFSNVRLTWDDDDDTRFKMTHRKFKREDIKRMNLEVRCMRGHTALPLFDATRLRSTIFEIGIIFYRSMWHRKMTKGVRARRTRRTSGPNTRCAC